MKTRTAFSTLLVTLGLCITATSLHGQTFYSPLGVGVAGTDSTQGNTTTTASIFAWDLNSNSLAGDSYTRSGSSVLSITSGEFRVVLGSGVDLNNAFWSIDRPPVLAIIKSGNGTLPILTTGAVSAFSYTGGTDGSGTFTPLNISNRGFFSLSGNQGDGYSVGWTAIPEPTTALAGILLAGGLFRRRRVA